MKEAKDSPTVESPKKEVFSLEDTIVKYDIQAMIRDVNMEFEGNVSERNLVDQQSIMNFFKAKEDDDERN